MKPPRGLKTALKSTQSMALSGCGKFRGFCVLDGQRKKTNVKLKGLTKKLETKVFSQGAFPSVVTHGTERRTAWKGKSGGIRRGSAVDAQLSRLINAGKTTPSKKMLVLSRYVLICLKEMGLTPVMAQRACGSRALNVATAADFVCYNCTTNRIVVVELKCGFSGSRTTSAIRDGVGQTMRGPLSLCPDTVLNRHFAQLACTTELTRSDAALMGKLASLGVQNDKVESVLVYANETQCDVFKLSKWWTKKASSVLTYLF